LNWLVTIPAMQVFTHADSYSNCPNFRIKTLAKVAGKYLKTSPSRQHNASIKVMY